MINREQYIIDKYKIDTTKQSPYCLEISRWRDLPKLLSELEVKEMAEIGVEVGKYSECLLNGIPNLKLYSIDPWEVYEDYRIGIKDKVEEYYKQAVQRLNGRCEIIKKFSVEAAKDFSNESLDAVFIDANHDLVNVINDIDIWSKKVKKGGIMIGHDYFNQICEHERIDVKTAVDAWVQTHDIKTWFITTKKERRSCWLWINK